MIQRLIDSTFAYRRFATLRLLEPASSCILPLVNLYLLLTTDGPIMDDRPKFYGETHLGGMTQKNNILNTFLNPAFLHRACCVFMPMFNTKFTCSFAV
jgi:hypothetical protein